MPGALLYLPRGFIHEAVTDEAMSLHFTASLNTVRWAAFLKELVQVIAEDVIDLRTSIPPRVLKTSRDGNVRPLLDVIERMGVNEAYFQRAIARVQDSILTGMQRLPLRTLADARDSRVIEKNTRVSRAADQVCCIQVNDRGVTLRGIGFCVQFSPRMLQIAKFISVHDEFSPAEMPDCIPIDDRIRIVSELRENGFLVRCAAEGENRP